MEAGSEVPQPAWLRLGLPISTQSGTVLFVNRASRFIRRRLNQQAGIGLTQRPQADIRLPQTYNFYDRLTLELRLYGQPAGASLFPELC